MSILRITSTSPTPEERKAIEVRERKRDEAQQKLAAALTNLKLAHAEAANARREYKKALNDLVTYREKLEPSKNS